MDGLTRAERRILCALKLGGIWSSADLLKQIGYEHADKIVSGTIRVHVSHLRRKGWDVRNKRGHGYFLAWSPPETETMIG